MHHANRLRSVAVAARASCVALVLGESARGGERGIRNRYSFYAERSSRCLRQPGRHRGTWFSSTVVSWNVVQNPTISLSDDVRVTKRAIAAQNGTVILVGHSYEGVVITEAGNDDKVVGLVYIAAFAGQGGIGLEPDQGSAARGASSSDSPAPRRISVP